MIASVFNTIQEEKRKFEETMGQPGNGVMLGKDVDRELLLELREILGEARDKRDFKKLHAIESCDGMEVCDCKVHALGSFSQQGVVRIVLEAPELAAGLEAETAQG